MAVLTESIPPPCVSSYYVFSFCYTVIMYCNLNLYYNIFIIYIITSLKSDSLCSVKCEVNKAG